ncbi:MAG: TIGR01777 family oxidoreductase [Desulfobacterales bacterium]|nr:TIGR01777 family oxidoreductase [Desulfobacterales bacterium]
MNIVISGGTGFVGAHLVDTLLEAGHSVTALGRSRHHQREGHAQFKFISADTTQPGTWQEAVTASDACINLAGASIFQRWTTRSKGIIRDSRILTTRNLVAALADNRKTFLFSASGVGYYGDRGDEALTEDAHAGDDFLARLGIEWEAEAEAARQKGARVVLGRLGVVLHQDGGAMAKMLPAFKLGLGGPLGSGRQWFPWIHLDDLIAAILFLMKHEDSQGAFNFCAPEAVTNRTLARTLGNALQRPAFMPAPALFMKTVLGEFSSVLLGSQKATPERLLQSGFEFQYATLERALEAILKK